MRTNDTATHWVWRFRCISRLASLLLLLVAGPMTGWTAVRYVNASQTNNPPNGSSWTTAYPTVKQALNVAINGDSVWVARGVYAENNVLSNGVALYGGFGATETLLGQRNWQTNRTILDGRQSNSVVIVAAGALAATRLDGFVIQNGRASSGGGIYCSAASPTVVNNQILRNTATNNGGGVFVASGSPLIASNLIQGNLLTGLSASGAGVGAQNSSLKIVNNRIAGNVASSSGFFAGGGVACEFGGSPEIRGNVIVANWVGGGFGATAGGVLVLNVSEPKILNNTILWNGSASTGPAGIYCDTATAVIANNIVAFGAAGVNGPAGMTFKHNNVFGNGNNNFIGFPNPTGANGNLSVDPQLVSDPYYPDFHLLASSPCRDAGDDSSVPDGAEDIDGDSRFFGAAVDIGADEFNGAAPVATNRIVFVSTAGDDFNDGWSWASAKRSVQAAIELASVAGGEVWVRAGTYQQNLTLRHFAYLYGGFLGNETVRSQRNWFTNLSILDGGQAGSVVSAASLQHWSAIDGLVIRNGAAANGSGIFCNYSSPVIANNTITNNVGTNANSRGGGIHLFGSASVVTNNIISFNRASVGGGISCGGLAGVPLIVRNRVEGNVAGVTLSSPGSTAYGGGGLLAYSSGKPVIEGNLFLRNVATNTAGSSRPGEGGAICVDFDATPRIVNNTMLTNLATSSQGFYLENGGGIYSRSATAVMANNVIAFGSSGLSTVKFAADTTFSNAQHNCVYGNGTNYLRMPDLTGTNRNISVDPLLQGPSDFHLAANSPCINSGNTNFVAAGTDFDGNPRIVGGPVDLGAHEYQTPGSVISYAWLQQYGLPTDGSVDYADSDGDGANTWLEWRYETVPTNASSAPAPVFLVQPLSFSQAPGIAATFSVTVEGALPVHLQWQLNEADLPGANLPTLTVSNLQAGNLGTYRVIATNAFGTMISSNATLAFGQIAAWGSFNTVPLGATNLLATTGYYGHMLWLRGDYTVSGWGNNYYLETTIPPDCTNVVAIDAVDATSLALKSDGTVVAWGRQEQSDVPFGLTGVVAISLGGEHTLALKADGSVVAWGFGSLASVPIPFTNAVAIAAGPNNNLVMRADGSVYSWGDNVFGQLDVPVGLSNVVAVAAGYSYDMALKADRTLVMWGSATTATNIPIGLSNVVAIASGDDHCLALRADGTVVAWGRNNFGQTNVPSGLTNVTAISAGAWSSLALVGELPVTLQAPMVNPHFDVTGFHVQVQTHSGRVYRLEYKESPDDADWQALPLAAGNGSLLTLTDPSTAGSQRYYRVRRW